MRCIEIQGAGGGPECLARAERACPIPGMGQILIKVAFAGVNRPDILQRAGLYAPPKGASDLLGLEASGEVVAIGPGGEIWGGTRWEVGAQVTALLPGGGYSTYALTEASHSLPIPKGMSLKAAAALPETFFTVWSNLIERGRLKAGERVLIHGGSSGIGTTAIQLANCFGARVFTTAGSEKKCTACEKLGAERAINYREEDFVEIMRSEGGAHLILAMVGGDYIGRNLTALADEGRLVQIAFLGGARAEVNFAQVMTRRLEIMGSTLRPRSIQEKARIGAELLANVWPLLEAGALAPVIDSLFDFERVADAHRYMESSAHIGKIILQVDPSLGD